MFPIFADVPAYPLVFVVFWGAAAIFVLAMARHLRVFAAARPVAEHRTRSATSGGALGLVEYALVQRKMFRGPPAAGIMPRGSSGGSSC